MKIRILYIEDNKPDTKWLELQISKYKDYNIELIIKEYAEDAIKLLQKDYSFDVLIIDLNLPKMSGEEFIDTIIKHNGINEIPRIILSGSRKISDSLKKKVYAYIEKPIHLNEVLQVILSSLRNKLKWIQE